MGKDLNIKLRSKILNQALILESILNDFLKLSLDIRLSSSTKTLSYKASSIAFKTKIDLLLDIEKIDKSQYDSFDKFMNIRNQFMHNIHANSYSYIAEHIDGIENWLIKNYPVKDKGQLKILEFAKETDKNEGSNSERENSLEFMINNLNGFLYEVLINMIGRNKKEAEENISGMVGFNYYKIIYENIDTAFDAAFASESANLKKGSIDINELDNFGIAVKAKIRKFLNQQIENKMPIGSGTRNWLETQIKGSSKEEKDNLDSEVTTTS